MSKADGGQDLGSHHGHSVARHRGETLCMNLALEEQGSQGDDNVDVCNWGRYACKAQSDEGQDEEQNGKLGPGLTMGSGGVHSGTRHRDRPVILDTSLYFCACGKRACGIQTLGQSISKWSKRGFSMMWQNFLEVLFYSLFPPLPSPSLSGSWEPVPSLAIPPSAIPSGLS